MANILAVIPKRVSAGLALALLAPALNACHDDFCGLDTTSSVRSHGDCAPASSTNVSDANWRSSSPV